jgi:aldehyde:ferredoxin oxidoreductase
MLKRTGVDGIIFEGASPEPVYLYLRENKAELRSARHLWGKDVHETDELLGKETERSAKSACIGPAGEREVLFASIMNDRDRAAGRSGVGAVMGAKKLKAIVAKGSLKIPLHDEKAFRSLVKEHLDRFKDAYKQSPPPLRVHGTAITVVGTQNVGVFPSYNFRTGTFERWEDIGGERLTREIQGVF